MPTERFAPLARTTGLLRSSSAVAWWLGALVGVAGGVLVERFVVAPDYVPLLFVGGVGPGTYYLTHHPDVLSDESRPWDVASVWPFLVFFLIPGDAGWMAVGVTVISFAGVGIAVTTMAHLDVRAGRDREPEETAREVTGEGDDPTARARAFAVRQDSLRRWTTRSWPARHAREAWTWAASVLRSNRTVARCLGVIAGVAGFLTVGELPAVPDVVPWLVLFSLGPFAYYRTHYGRVPVDVPGGRRFLRTMAVVVPTAGLTDEGASLPSVAVTALAFGLLLASVTLAEQSRYLPAGDAPGDGGYGDGAGGDDEEPTAPWRRATWSEDR
ncbi:hypothetical protein [Halorubellus salinus]|uniref:hypothetical protein n=1 Tax=Halorubellus salinus TaxID=755309 RepID=UPI001D08BEBE|nr:hypothetical protein [Halorubellus salinus]